MSYRNKTYIAFNADGGDLFGDMKYYNLMRAWDSNKLFDFDFYNAHDMNNLWAYSTEETIKGKLRERLNNSKNFILLIGKDTKSKHKYVRWEIEEAIKQGLPIIVVNLNGSKRMDSYLCPPILQNTLAVHIPFGEKILTYALNNWPDNHKTYSSEGKTSHYHYVDAVYNLLN